MPLKDDILGMIANDPVSFRSLIADSEIESALSDIGILPKVLELHAPSTNARISTGLGNTLCGIKGTRHSEVTCKRCLAKLTR